jgi:hypothetical protein
MSRDELREHLGWMLRQPQWRDAVMELGRCRSLREVRAIDGVLDGAGSTMVAMAKLTS